MNNFRLALVAFTLLLSACATQSLNKNRQAWEDLGKSDVFQKEKATYFQRLNDHTFCWEVGIDDFLAGTTLKPDSKCIYPASKLVVQYDDGTFIKSKELGQRYMQLKILQVTPEGFVIKSPDYRKNQVIFIYKTDEGELVDGSVLDETQNFKLYEYVGTYSYQTLTGSKTVYSFRKASKRLADARKDIKYYDPLREFLIKHELWGNLGELPKN